VLVAVAVFAPVAAYAQASLSGTVRDASGGVLPGVSVEASSPALIEKVRAVVTDETGQYRIVDLRPGVYKVTFSLAGFGTVEREGIELTGTMTATVHAELKVGSLEERITVTGATPVVDVENTRQQRVVSSEVIDAIPSSRTALSVATLIPGVTGSATDVGGTNSVGLYTATSHGGRASDFKTTIDGFGTGNSYNYFSAMMPNMGSAQEVTVDVAAASAEQGPGGVVVNVVPKEGGNDFSGSFFASGANGDLQGDNFSDRVRQRGLRVVNSIKGTYDINPSSRRSISARSGVGTAA
jgi:iron complex outermembrane receptor protein